MEKLSGINIRNTGMTESDIPAIIWQLPHLETIDIRDNPIKSLPPEIGNVKKLYALYADNTELEYLPDEIGNCSKLNTIYLRNCNLKTLPKSLCKLEALDVLEIYQNPLEYLPACIDGTYRDPNNPLPRHVPRKEM